MLHHRTVIIVIRLVLGLFLCLLFSLLIIRLCVVVERIHSDDGNSQHQSHRTDEDKYSLFHDSYPFLIPSRKQRTKIVISHSATGLSRIQNKKPTCPTPRWESNTSAYSLMSLPNQPDCSSFNLPKISACTLSDPVGIASRLPKRVLHDSVEIRRRSWLSDAPSTSNDSLEVEDLLGNSKQVEGSL